MKRILFLLAAAFATAAATFAQQPAQNELPAATPAPAAPAGDSSGTTAARPGLVSEREVITQLQIFLDQQIFGPGIIDGRWGEFTQKALGRYQRAHALAVDAPVPVETVYPVYTTYEIKPDDLKFIGDVPHSQAEQAKKKALLYTSLLEFIEERYHVSPDFLRRLNAPKNMDALKPGDIVRVPNVEPFKIEELKEIGHLPKVPEFKTRTVHVDTKTKMLDIYDGEKLLASLPITPGSERLPAPKGTFTIVGIAILPWFRWDEGVLEHGVRTANFFNLPSGPNNPVGVLWTGLSKPGIGIHGTNTPETIGRAGSHGCIRLANWDAIRFSKMVSEGMTVKID